MPEPGDTKIDWGDDSLSGSPLHNQNVPFVAEQPTSDDKESILYLVPGLGLNEVSNTIWVTPDGERKQIASPGEIKQYGLTRMYAENNGQILVTDDEGRIYLGNTSPILRQYLREHGCKPMVENPGRVSIYIPQASDRKQV